MHAFVFLMIPDIECLRNGGDIAAPKPLLATAKGGASLDAFLLQFPKILVNLALEQKHTIVCFGQKESGPRVVKSGNAAAPKGPAF